MKHLVALLNSHIEGDDERFLSVALQVAATEAREGRTEEAERLRDLVQKARDQRRNRPGTPRANARRREPALRAFARGAFTRRSVCREKSK